MAKNKIKVRPWAKMLPAPVWAIGIDLLDWLIVPLSIFPPVGEGAGLTMDAIQTMLALAVFEDDAMWLIGGGVDFIIPQPFDALAMTFTGRYLYSTYIKK